MTQSEIVSVFKSALIAVDYDEERIRRNYEFSDLSGTARSICDVSLWRRSQAILRAIATPVSV